MYLINQLQRLYWENIGPSSRQDAPNAASDLYLANKPLCFVVKICILLKFSLVFTLKAVLYPGQNFRH